MDRLQMSFIAGAIILLSILMFGFDTKPKSQKKVEERRVNNFSNTSIEKLLTDALKELGEADKVGLSTLYVTLDKDEEEDKVETLKKISSFWFEKNRLDLSGHYAFEVAEIENSKESWNIAGSTFTLCLQRKEEANKLDFCLEKGVESFKNAISLDSDFVDPRINLALLYVEKPPQDNPMKGILMMLDLQKQYPSNVGILNNLGRLAIQTNQIERAIERFKSVVKIDPDNKVAICALAAILPDTDAEVAKYQSKCDS